MSQSTNENIQDLSVNGFQPQEAGAALSTRLSGKGCLGGHCGQTLHTEDSNVMSVPSQQGCLKLRRAGHRPKIIAKTL